MNRIFYQLVLWKCQYRLKRKGAGINPQRIRQFQELYVKMDVEEMVRDYEVRQVKKLVYGLTLLCLFTILLFLFHPMEESYLRNGLYLTRPAAGFQEYSLYVEGLSQKHKIEIQMNERDYTDEELEDVFEETKNRLIERALGKNESWDKISEPLDFMVQPLDERIRADWRSEDMDLIDSFGEVHNKAMAGSEEETEVWLNLRYGSYEKDYKIAVKLIPKVLSLEEKERELLESLISEELILQKHENEIKLPLLAEGRNLSYSQPRRSDYLTMAALGLLGVFLLVSAEEEKLKSEVKKREEQMILDYAGIVSKLTLLADCGLTVRGAWEKIVKDYMSKIQENRQEKRYAYEEMQLVWYLLQNGTMEGKTYEIFAKRCRVSCYIKLGSLLEQNLRRGTSQLKRLLEEEVENAYRQRKQLVKKMGEEAGTKLLGPMIIMFVILLIIIFVPAILSFSTI